MHVGQAGCSDDFSHSASNSLCVPHAVKHLLHPMPTRLMPATLVVGGVRNVYDWLMAMKRRCYCCDDFEKMELPAFLRTPFSNTKFDDGTCSWAADVVFQDRNRLFHNIIEAPGPSWWSQFKSRRVQRILPEAVSRQAVP